LKNKKNEKKTRKKNWNGRLKNKREAHYITHQAESVGVEGVKTPAPPLRAQVAYSLGTCGGAD